MATALAMAGKQEPEPKPKGAEREPEGAELLLSNACFTPFVGPSSADDTEPPPVIGRAPGISGLSVAVGHHVWGITLGPATGLAIAALLCGAEKSQTAEGERGLSLDGFALPEERWAPA